MSDTHDDDIALIYRILEHEGFSRLEDWPEVRKRLDKAYLEATDPKASRRYRQFISKIDFKGKGECWEWQAHRKAGGYGMFAKTGSSKLAHRLAFELANMMPIPDGMVVMHQCDNPPCCNPWHLKLGTQEENMREAADRGRHRRGEKVHCSKLNAKSVTEIRSSGKSPDALAKQFGVTSQAISKVINRQTWKHV